MGGCLGEYHANSSIVDMIHAYSEYAVSVKHIKYEPVGKGSNPGISRVGEETVIDKQRIRIQKPKSLIIQTRRLFRDSGWNDIAGGGGGGCKT